MQGLPPPSRVSKTHLVASGKGTIPPAGKHPQNLNFDGLAKWGSRPHMGSGI